MFNKPTFGATGTTGFGSFNSGATATASPFGGFKPAANTSAFGAPPSFGAAATQPATGGLFGASNTSTGLFGGSTSTAAPAFGTASTGFGGFGASTSSGGLFGSNTTSTGLFGNAQNTSAFGAKPAGSFGFGGTTTTGTTGGGLFGATPAASGGLFGQQNNTLGGGLFSSNTSTFGQQQQAAGTAHVKYSPVVGTDVVVKGGTSQNVNIKHHCITCMKEYESKSLEELRLEDYTAGRKGSASAGVFGFQQTEQKPLFGATTAFGQPATTTASSVFGGGGLATTGGFGQTSTFSFGNNTQNATNTTGGGLFGAAKPAFGATNTTGKFYQ
ncbi:hypothetical protein O0L34_g10571 [Tuta absoluta]|nr:hypothetical protein O0L34_g10571 [Tuta absoluta]